MHLAKISKSPFLTLALFSFNFPLLWAHDSCMLLFSLQWRRRLPSPMFHLPLSLLRYTLGRVCDTSLHSQTRAHPWPHSHGVSEVCSHFPRAPKSMVPACAATGHMGPLVTSFWLWGPPGYLGCWFGMLVSPDTGPYIFSTTSLWAAWIVWFPGSLWCLLIQNSGR